MPCVSSRSPPRGRLNSELTRDPLIVTFPLERPIATLWLEGGEHSQSRRGSSSPLRTPSILVYLSRNLIFLKRGSIGSQRNMSLSTREPDYALHTSASFTSGYSSSPISTSSAYTASSSTSTSRTCNLLPSPSKMHPTLLPARPLSASRSGGKCGSRVCARETGRGGADFYRYESVL